MTHLFRLDNSKYGLACVVRNHSCIGPESNCWPVTIGIHISTEISKTSHPRDLKF